jgi:very-short-patch-repair endonuclease
MDARESAEPHRIGGERHTRADGDRESAEHHRIGGERHTGANGDRECAVDHLIARLAGQRRGVVTRAQLLAGGVSRRQIDTRLRDGRLHPLHRGVVAVGHLALHPDAPLVAALLAVGPGAVLSHRTAAVRWGLVPIDAGLIRLTNDASRPTRHRGLLLHRAVLESSERTRCEGLPITTPLRTLQDLAATEPALLDRAVNEAYARGLARPGDLAPRPGQRGAKLLRHVVGTNPGVTRSTAERALRRLLTRAGLPVPETNVAVGPWEVDLRWAEQRVVAEVDGYAAHSSRRAWERDHRKDADLKRRGYDVVRLSYSDITDHSERTVATLALMLLHPSR